MPLSGVSILSMLLLYVIVSLPLFTNSFHSLIDLCYIGLYDESSYFTHHNLVKIWVIDIISAETSSFGPAISQAGSSVLVG